MQFDRIPDRLTEQVDRVRDRTAEAMGSDGGSVLRELGKLGRKIDGTEKHLSDRLDDLVDAARDTEDRLDDLDTSASTTWPRRLFWIAVGMGAGAVAAYLADPDRGDQRRHEIVGQAQDRVRSVTDDVSERARHVKDEVVDRAQDVKDTAVASAQSVTDEAKRAAEDVKDEAQTAVVDVRDEAQDAAENVKEEVNASGSTDGATTVPTNAPTSPSPGR